MARPYFKLNEETTSRTLESHQVILRPLVTEKGVQTSEDLNQYTFEIAPAATKLDVRRAIEELFDVKVTSVKTQTRKGKARRYRFRNGKTRNWKKAIITLAEDQKIDFY
ncbi:50S ribosomal protein L23 [Blastopirellula marina]|uniref:Large ribosomal subunit protein uL23 n=1 Tax=Blastopirellula marina TaxID=124 RepID=A0A2S8FH21_9BACT|nr:50S ribosomal protein L23 [Blastopirellula marina]PQO31469.1 50S ribosomal protein L23 [Blastopirellula marina]PTL42774.1 50S ribosomal protein L23 [Blastopirellula marina]